MATNTGPGLRELSRLAVRDQIARRAEELFIAQGFDETTVDDIATAVGMSQRSFFRYFPTKEDVVLSGYEKFTGDVVERLATRPLDEPEWDSLRRAFDAMVDHFADAVERQHAIEMQRVMMASPALTAALLGQMDRMQQSLTDELMARRQRRGVPGDRVVLRAMVGSGFACVHAVGEHLAVCTDPLLGDEYARQLDAAMAALRPHACPN